MIAESDVSSVDGRTVGSCTVSHRYLQYQHQHWNNLEPHSHYVCCNQNSNVNNMVEGEAWGGGGVHTCKQEIGKMKRWVNIHKYH